MIRLVIFACALASASSVNQSSKTSFPGAAHIVTNLSCVFHRNLYITHSQAAVVVSVRTFALASSVTRHDGSFFFSRFTPELNIWFQV